MVTQEQFIKNAHKIAVESLKNFFRNLDFDEEAFNHLYNIELSVVDFLPPDEESLYIHTESLKEDPLDNTIVLNSRILKKYVSQCNSDKEKYNRLVLQLATSLVHEMIHANRMIIMDYVTKERNEINPNKPPIESWHVRANLLSEFYHNTNYLSEEEESDRIYYQGDFEETITETLADMIIETRKDDKFDLEELNTIIQNSNADMVLKIGSQILKNMGIDTVKWFMTAAYENSYYDKFEHTFGDQYDDLLYDVSDIYTTVYCNRTVDRDTVNNVKRILEEKTKNKR